MRFDLRWLIAALFFVLPLGSMAADQAVGKVIIAAGDAWAENTTGERRKLRRRAPFFVGETLATGNSGKLQVRFVDGAVLALRAQSRLRIDDYRFDADKPADGRSFATLLQGGFRTITGIIGKFDPEAYRVDTPVATIGVRGTHYELASLAGELAVGVWQGGVRVSNEHGALDIGVGAPFDFAKVQPNRPPRGQLLPPPVLGPPPAAPAGESPPGQPGQLEQPVPSSDGEALLPSPSLASDLSNPLDGSSPLLTLDPAAGGSDSTLLVDPSFVPLLPPTNIPQGFFTDQRLSDAERQRLASDGRYGIVVLGGTSPANLPGMPSGLTGGKATAADLGPIITQSAVDPATNSFADVAAGGFSQIYRRASAPNLPPPNPVPANPGFNIEWGAWDANAATPFKVQTDATNPATVVNVDKPLFWMTAVPVSKAVLDVRSGLATFNTMIAAFGHGNGVATSTQIVTADVDITLQVDFNTGNVLAGLLRIGNASAYPEKWVVNFTGQLNGPAMVIPPTSISGTVDAVPGVTGEIGGILTGVGGTKMGGGFNLDSTNNNAIHAEGLFVISE